MDESLKRALRILIILILVLINVAILIKNLIKIKKPTKLANVNISIANTENNNIENETAQNTIKAVESKMYNMSENKRIQTYFGEFIDKIENSNYQEAYDMLNDEYKKNYFPNETDFENYVKNTYPKGTLVVDYNEFARKGDIYVLEVSIYSITDENTNKLNQTIAIRENGVNDFKISFSK